MNQPSPFIYLSQFELDYFHLIQKEYEIQQHLYLHIQSIASIQEQQLGLKEHLENPSSQEVETSWTLPACQISFIWE